MDHDTVGHGTLRSFWHAADNRAYEFPAGAIVTFTEFV